MPGQAAVRSAVVHFQRYAPATPLHTVWAWASGHGGGGHGAGPAKQSAHGRGHGIDLPLRGACRLRRAVQRLTLFRCSATFVSIQFKSLRSSRSSYGIRSTFRFHTAGRKVFAGKSVISCTSIRSCGNYPDASRPTENSALATDPARGAVNREQAQILG